MIPLLKAYSAHFLYKAIVQSYLKTLRVCHNSFSFYNRAKDVMDKLLSDCRKYNTDYISMSAHLACCEECNKLQGRVYSISGKSKIFPKLPDVIRETGKVHNGCAHSFSVFFYTGKNDTIFDKNGNDVNAIKSSQRPFKDDRTAEEKKNYLKSECGVELTKELEGKVEAMGESMGRVILQGMLEDAWDKGVEEERKKTEENGRTTDEKCSNPKFSQTQRAGNKTWDFNKLKLNIVYLSRQPVERLWFP